MNTAETPQKALVFGGSKNIGYHAALRLLERGYIVTFLLRNAACFDEDMAIRPYIKFGQVRLVKGDALVESDVGRVWAQATQGGEESTLNLILFSIGATKISLGLNGLTINPPNICSGSILNVLATMPAALREPGRQPRLVVISSTGLGKDGRAALPFPNCTVYGAMLGSPLRDKLALERIVSHASGGAWFDAQDAPATDKLVPNDWAVRAGAPGALADVVIVRPAWLTDGNAKGVYRTEPLGAGLKTVSRKDVAHFIVEDVLQHWDQWRGKATGVGY